MRPPDAATGVGYDPFNDFAPMTASPFTPQLCHRNFTSGVIVATALALLLGIGCSPSATARTTDGKEA